MLAFPIIPPCFQPVPPTSPPSLSVDSSCAARATYMHVWHARAHDACIRVHAIAYHSPRRSPRLAQALE